MITLTPLNTMHAATDLSGRTVLRKFPNLQFALSEGGTGWMPYWLERIDYMYQQHRFWTRQDFGDKLPSQVALDHFSFCFISDRAGVEDRDAIGVDNITWECDYPHSDSTWPNSPETLAKQLDGVPEDDDQQDDARERDADLPVRPVRAPTRRSSAPSGRCAPRRATSCRLAAALRSARRRGRTARLRARRA